MTADRTTRDQLAAALADPSTYSEAVQLLGAEIARCHICVAGSASEGDTQDVIDRHRAHRAALSAPVPVPRVQGHPTGTPSAAQGNSGHATAPTAHDTTPHVTTAPPVQPEETP